MQLNSIGWDQFFPNHAEPSCNPMRAHSTRGRLLNWTETNDQTQHYVFLWRWILEVEIDVSVVQLGWIILYTWWLGGIGLSPVLGVVNRARVVEWIQGRYSLTQTTCWSISLKVLFMQSHRVRLCYLELGEITAGGVALVCIWNRCNHSRCGFGGFGFHSVQSQRVR